MVLALESVGMRIPVGVLVSRSWRLSGFFEGNQRKEKSTKWKMEKGQFIWESSILASMDRDSIVV